MRSPGSIASVLLLVLAGVSVGAGVSQAVSIFALVDTGELYVSSDQGASWSVLSTLPVSDAAGLLAGTTSQRLFLASASGGVYRSLDGGMTWTAVGAIPASAVVDLAGRTDGGLLALTRSGTVYLSADQGVTFAALGALTASNCVSLTLGPSGDPYALTGTGEIAESTDDGATWTVVGTIPVSDAVSLRRMGSGLFALTDTGLTFESTDLGASWTPVGTASQVGMRGLTPVANQLLAVTREGLTARSADGSSWTWVGSVNQLEVVALANDVPQVTGVPSEPGTTTRLLLSPPRPNPLFAGRVMSVSLSLPADDRVALQLFDARGRRVALREAEPLAAGDDVEIRWDPGIGTSGVYFLRVLATDSGTTADARVVILD